MATVRWVAKQRKRVQVYTVTITAGDAATTYKITIGAKVVSVVGYATVTLVATALYDLLVASEDGEFQEITWTNPSAGVVKATANEAGKPFTLVASVTGGTGTISGAATTTNLSPNDANDGVNYSTGALPALGDTMLYDFGNEDQSVLWNLDALAAINLDTLIRRRTFTGRIGLDEINTDGTPYTEYRVTELTFGLQGSFLINVEQPASDAAGHVKLNTSTLRTNLNVTGDGPGQLYNEQLWWRGTHINNAVFAKNCSLAVLPVSENVSGYTAVVSSLTAENSSVRLGAGVTTLTTVTALNSYLEINSTVGTFTITGGAATVKNSAAATTITADRGASVTYLSNGTITTLTLGHGCGFSRGGDVRALVITNAIPMYQGSSFIDPQGTVIAGGLDITTVKCGIEDVRIVAGQGHSLAITA